MKIIKQTLLEIARVGFIGSYEIYIRTDDPGNIPHMHIWDYSTKGEKFNTCVRLDKAEYFHHTGKEDILNSKIKKNLIEFLKQPYRNSEITNWAQLLRLWNDNNSNVKVDENIEMPDYEGL